jgi:hypothetical protein
MYTVDFKKQKWPEKFLTSWFENIPDNLLHNKDEKTKEQNW